LINVNSAEVSDVKVLKMIKRAEVTLELIQHLVARILWMGYWMIGILSPIFEWLRPKQPVQRVLSEWIDDKYPYLKRWIAPDEDSEDSELEGYESSAVMDEEDLEN
jgi:hypothetical protein